MPRFPTPIETMMLSLRASIAVAEAGRTFWQGMAAASLWWMPPAARPAPARSAAAKPPARAKRKARG